MVYYSSISSAAFGTLLVVTATGVISVVEAEGGAFVNAFRAISSQQQLRGGQTTSFSADTGTHVSSPEFFSAGAHQQDSTRGVLDLNFRFGNAALAPQQQQLQPQQHEGFFSFLFLDQEVHPGKHEQMVGADDTLLVSADGSNVPPRYRKILPAIGLITLADNHLCTGTHVGNGIVVTAGHCFAGEKKTINIRNGKCQGTTVAFGVFHDKKTPMFTASCKKIHSAVLSDEVDFAYFEIDRIPPTKIPVSDKRVRAVDGSKVTIFGHPNGRPLTWSRTCAVLKSYKGNTLTSKKQFLHLCDTEGGNSGSAIIDDKTLTVIGIHDGAQNFTLSNSNDVVRTNYGSYVFDTIAFK